MDLVVLAACFMNLHPRQVAALDAFKEAGRFVDRIAFVQKEAETFFIRYPDQDIEGLFFEIVQDTVAASRRRNDLAHGVIRSEDFPPTSPRSYLVPSMHRSNRWATTNIPDYAYKSDDIHRFGQGFCTIRVFIHDLCEHIQAMRAASLGKRP